MSESEGKKVEYKRTVVCECGVELDLRTQGLLCAGCRAKFKLERRRNMEEACERYFRRHWQPSPSEGAGADVGALVDAIDRLVDALEWDRKDRGRRTWPSTSLVLPTMRSADARIAPVAGHVGGIPADRLEWD